MSAQKVSMRSRDLISSMPDEVLGKILSLLPTRLSASTSVLSKRWRNLLSLVDTLHFSDEIGNPRGFFDFVDTTLARLSNSSIIKTFSLTCKHSLLHRHCESSRVDKWIRTVLEGGFLELHLDGVGIHHIQSEFFTSNTLAKLTLSNEFYLDGLGPLGGLFFPKLKSLSLLSVGFWDDTSTTYEYLISGCPVLDELLLSYGELYAGNGFGFIHSIEVLNPAVKRLTISYHFHGYVEPPISEVFRTPSLVYLDYSSYVTRKYTVELDSLVEARLDLRSRDKRVLVAEEDCFDVVEDDTTEDDGYDYDDDDSEFGEDDNIDNAENNGIEVVAVDEDDGILPDVTDLVAGISNVKALHLSSDSLEGLLHKVTNRCGDACVCIAKENKKKMEEEVCCLFTCQVKVLNISRYGGTRRELRQMRHFLGNLKCLETVKVGVKAESHREDDNVNNNYQRITSALTKLPRASSNWIKVSSGETRKLRINTLFIERNDPLMTKENNVHERIHIVIELREENARKKRFSLEKVRS
ncbi:hypothetical protein Bca4012_018451 [Brassica carinata]